MFRANPDTAGNPGLARLRPYPFERLAALREGVAPAAGLRRISLGIGEPQDPPFAPAVAALQEALGEIGRYPPTRGGAALRSAACDWLQQRDGLPAGALDPERHLLPVNGTREALFAIIQCLIDPGAKQAVAMPSPGYQIYEGAALLAGADPVYIPCRADTAWLPDWTAVPDATWARVRALFVCSPGNPTGAVLGRDDWQQVLALADRWGFVILADECYREIYADEDHPPPGLLEVCHALGRSFERCLVFHSLSKRSNLPGLRSGFVAGDPTLIADFLRYRTYHGCAMALPVQAASVAAWRDETHVRRQREVYRERFATVTAALDGAFEVTLPAGSFYLWLPVADDEAFTLRAWREAHVEMVPGRYLSRSVNGFDPGAGHVRISLVAPLADCLEAAQRLRALGPG